jgi:hypothetical protein
MNQSLAPVGASDEAVNDRSNDPRALVILQHERDLGTPAEERRVQRMHGAASEQVLPAWDCMGLHGLAVF